MHNAIAALRVIISRPNAVAALRLIILGRRTMQWLLYEFCLSGADYHTEFAFGDIYLQRKDMILRQKHNAVAAHRAITLQQKHNVVAALRINTLRQKHNAVAALRVICVGQRAGQSHLL